MKNVIKTKKNKKNYKMVKFLKIRVFSKLKIPPAKIAKCWKREAQRNSILQINIKS